MEADMNYSYWRTERLILDAVDRRILQKTTAWDRIVSFLASGDLLAVMVMCAVGLLATFALLVFAAPKFGEIFEAFKIL
jgi:hypothetical protein